MSTRTITRAKLCINLLIFVLTLPALAEWKVDFSRRAQSQRSEDLRQLDGEPSSPVRELASQGERPMHVTPTEPKVSSQPGFFESLIMPRESSQEIVVLNTEKGFVPSTIRVKKGVSYQIHVVNVNEKEKNVSFVLDSFSEHHATFYGKIKSFTIFPQKEGVYRFVSPETASQGKLVVYPASPEARMPASE